MRRLTFVAALVAAVVVAVPALAAGTRINVPAKFASKLSNVKQKSKIAVRLPSFLDAGIKPSRVRPESSARKGKYRLDLGVGKDCHQATACFVAEFVGIKGGHRSNPVKVKLAKGIKGRFRGITCGASCAPASMEWKQGGVLYEIQFKGRKAKLKRLANQAIKAGPR